MLRLMLLVFVQLCILCHPDQGPVFSMALMRGLRCRPAIIDGRRRKYSTPAASCRQLLTAARAMLHEVADERLREPCA